MEPSIIKQFSKQEIIVLRDEIQSALDNIKLKYGLSELTLGSINFNESSFTAKTYGKLRSSEANNFETSEARFFAIRFGLPENLIGSEFVLDGDIFSITKIETRNSRYPIIAHCKENGKSIKITVQRTKELLEKYRVINITYQDVEPRRLND